ncbi:unnamed protein product [Brugia pahangi]|uniref:Transposase n=1 Tax=Brugia pahangi TaxID=6280 RepID=A0A0N4T6H9_BRUPA|nr:unnamed protein product [Brugia pahangi]
MSYPICIKSNRFQLLPKKAKFLFCYIPNKRNSADAATKGLANQIVRNMVERTIMAEKIGERLVTVGI